jgi:hypothetical protein
LILDGATNHGAGGSGGPGPICTKNFPAIIVRATEFSQGSTRKD